MKALVCAALAIALAGPAEAQSRYDRKLEEAVMAIVASKMGDIRGGFAFDAKPVMVIVQDNTVMGTTDMNAVRLAPPESPPEGIGARDRAPDGGSHDLLTSATACLPVGPSPMKAMAAPRKIEGRVRLDELLVERNLFATRSRARDAVLRGTVSVDGTVVLKAGAPVSLDARIEVADPASAYVSRAALKLAVALDNFGIDPSGRIALDVGASTGGFTQVLLERGAARVFAIDVGRGQLHEKLRRDPRVTTIEELNARDLVASHLDGLSPEIVVADVSFISLKLALPPALELAAPGARCVLLVKPQFEAGREAIGKGGVLRDPSEAERVAQGMRSWLAAQPGWRALGIIQSPIKGGDGNREFLLAGIKDQ